MIQSVGNFLNILALFAGLLTLVPLVSLLTKSKAFITLSTRLAGFSLFILTHIAHTVMWSGLLMMLIQVSAVVMRYVFGINFIWMQESITYLFAAMFLLGAGFVLVEDGHVRVDIFYSTMSENQKAFINIIGTYLFLLPVCGLILWASGGYVSASWIDLERSQDPSGIHAVFLLKSCIPAFATLMAMAGLVLAHRSVLQLLGLSSRKEAG